MNKIIKLGIVVIVALFTVTTIQAQKFGYLNSAAILQEMPAVKEANSNLETLQKQLQKKGQGMLAALQEKYVAVQQKVEAGTMSPKQQEVEAQALKAEETKIAQFEQDMIKQLREKETALLQPIINKVNNAIKDVAKENGYQFIFDASTNILLYAEESQDVSSLVKAKLGL